MFGLGGKAAMLKQQGPSKKCERCGLSHFSHHHDKCPHCVELNDAEVQELIDRQEAEAEGGASLGRMMLVGAVFIIVLLVVAV